MRPYAGQALLIDLTNKSASPLPIEDSVYENFLGGRGLCGFFLDMFLDEDPILFFTGAFTGSDVTGSGLCSVMHKSPMTGGLFRSEFGGDFAKSIKALGYDGLIIKGKSEETTSITISDNISFSQPTTSGFSTVKAGSSAEKGFVHCALIADDLFTTHRGGTGYLMHSKNLISISAKKTSLDFHKTDREEIDRLINASPSLTGRLGIGRFGTAAFYDLAYGREMLPHNFFGTKPEEATNANSLLNSCEQPSFSCAPCEIACKKKCGKTPLPDYDEFAMLLSVGIKIDDIPEVYAECFSQGYDVITICHCAALLNDKPAYDMIMHGDERMKNGAYAIDKNALTVKRLEIPSFDPRGAYGMALGYATSTNGADWKSALAITHEILRKPVATDRHSFDGKAWLNIASENAKAAADSLIVCGYTLFSVSLEEYAKTLSSLTGKEFTATTLSGIGNSIWMNEVKITRRLGFKCEDDLLPEHFFDMIDRELFESEHKKYQKMRGAL